MITRNEDQVGCVIDQSELPVNYPTHLHDAKFWEALGRVVATFGFLEEVLGKAIFSFTATRPYREEDIDEAYAKWPPKLEHALTDQLGSLINTYGKAVRDHKNARVNNFNDLLEDLRKASEIRNVLCHGSWRAPDSSGASVPHFVNKKKQVFAMTINIEFLNQTQRHAGVLAVAVINTVTHMGWQFPGSLGPGKVI